MTTVLDLGLYGTLGGAERALAELLGGLDGGRFRPLVVLATGGPLVERLRAAGTEVVVESFPTPPLYRLAVPWVLAAELRAAWRLRKLVRERGARILHCGDVLGLLLLLPAALAGGRVVYQVHYLGAGLRLLAWNLLALLATDVVVAYSADQRDSILRATRGLARRLVVVHPGIDPAPYGCGDRARLRAELGLADATPLVGLLARYDAWKGHAVFLEAARRVVDACPDARFVMAGGALNRESLPHVERCRAEVLARRAALGLEDRVFVLDHRGDVPDVLAGLDVVVCPSVREPFGMVLLEAMAAGRPVVASDSGGPAEIVEDGMSGLLFPTGDAAALAERLQRLLDDPALRERLAEGGRRRVREAFDRGRYARALEAIYVRLA
jgi:glycosyltransferase involved in cell wall biosynthesis